MNRRVLLAGLPLLLAAPSAAWAQTFSAFLARLRASAIAQGIPADVVASATANLRPNAKVLKLDHHQAEFTETWDTYSSHVLSQARITEGTQRYADDHNLLAAVTSRYGVSAEVLLGIWGLETNFGTSQGDFNVIDALTTLAWARQSSFFMGEVIAALRIVAAGDAPAGALLGSYAGAMGQPQFMPSVYLSLAVSFSGQSAPDIWNSDADSLASMANYLAQKGWQAGEPSSEPVLAPGVDPSLAGHDNVQTLSYWESQGVQRLAGAQVLPGNFPAALLLPQGAEGPAFLVYANFAAIRAYNPSDFYALAVGALGRTVLAS
jgi:membrane-bound lytic murein transglycosylase B